MVDLLSIVRERERNRERKREEEGEMREGGDGWPALHSLWGECRRCLFWSLTREKTCRELHTWAGCWTQPHLREGEGEKRERRERGREKEEKEREEGGREGNRALIGPKVLVVLLQESLEQRSSPVVYCFPLALRFIRIGEVLLGLRRQPIICFPVHSLTGCVCVCVCVCV